MEFLKLKWVYLTLLILTTLGCSIAPLTGGYSAKPLGKGNFEFTEITSFVKTENEANVLPLTNARVLLGVTDSLDLGVQADQITATLLGKYSFESLENPSFHKAILGGITHIATSEGWFVGGIASYEFGNFEPFFMFRFFEVTLNSSDFDYKYITTVDFAIRRFLFSNIGFKYWIKRDFAIGSEYSFPLNSKALGFRPSYTTDILVTFTF